LNNVQQSSIQVVSLLQLISNAEFKYLSFIPDGYEWSVERKLLFLNGVACGFPIASFHINRRNNSQGLELLVLDGSQRIKTLFEAFVSTSNNISFFFDTKSKKVVYLEKAQENDFNLLYSFDSFKFKHWCKKANEKEISAADQFLKQIHNTKAVVIYSHFSSEKECEYARHLLNKK
jgi:hypothetical protein